MQSDTDRLDPWAKASVCSAARSVSGPALGQNKPTQRYRSGKTACKVAQQKRTQGADWHQSEYDPACTQSSQEGQRLPGLYQRWYRTSRTVTQFWAPYFKKNTEVLEQFQSRAKELVKGLENKFYEEQIKEFWFSLEKKEAQERPYHSL